jgi:MerR family transcriptional regulator/heat shock protein HspR
MSDVTHVCSVSKRFVLFLERENLITPVLRKNEKVYALKDVDRIRVARILVREMGVNLEGVEVVLHMRDQIIGMRRRLVKLISNSRNVSANTGLLPDE